MREEFEGEFDRGRPRTVGRMSRTNLDWYLDMAESVQVSGNGLAKSHVPDLSKRMTEQQRDHQTWHRYAVSQLLIITHHGRRVIRSSCGRATRDSPKCAGRPNTPLPRSVIRTGPPCSLSARWTLSASTTTSCTRRGSRRAGSVGQRRAYQQGGAPTMVCSPSGKLLPIGSPRPTTFHGADQSRGGIPTDARHLVGRTPALPCQCHLGSPLRIL